MTYLQLANAHLATVVPAFLIGTWLMLRRKGTPGHRALGKLYMLLMLITAVTTLFMPAEVGLQLFSHFGWIHSFSLLTLYSVPVAWFAVQRHNIEAHRQAMIGLYVGGILIAGGFTLAPGRMLHGWLFG